ncbi:MAG: DUF4376 domain-containing protein [Alphaproteobacteria bacterium]
MNKYAKILNGRVIYPPKTQKTESRTIINYDKNYDQLKIDGWKIFEEKVLDFSGAFEVFYEETTDKIIKKYIKIVKSIEQAKSDKLSEIKTVFNHEQENGHCASSLGFEIDATRLSKDDIESLLYVDLFPIKFRDHDNDFHDLTKEQAETLKKEIIAYGLAVYQKKWELEEAIKNATTIEDVEAVSWE